MAGKLSRASRLAGAALVACGLLLTAACSAHNDDAGPVASAAAVALPSAATASADAAAPPSAPTNFTQGNEYVRIGRPAGQAAPTGAVEVVEVFSYGCPHCAEFAPYMDKLRAQLPNGVEVRYMPAVFNASWLPFAQAYYAARDLGVFKQTHDALFKAMLEHYPLNSLQDLSAWYGRHGVDPQKFLAAATSVKTTQQIQADQRLWQGWGVDSTPTLVVGRRASGAADAPFVAELRSNNITSYGQLQQLGLWMADNLDKH